jgi:hypothetical protein
MKSFKIMIKGSALEKGKTVSWAELQFSFQGLTPHLLFKK